MAKKKTDQKIQELKEVLQGDKAVIGRNLVLKLLKQGKLAKIFLAKNAAPDLVADLEHYTKLAKIELVALEQDNEELGVLAKKNHFIAVVGVAN